MDAIVGRCGSRHTMQTTHSRVTSFRNSLIATAVFCLLVATAAPVLGQPNLDVPAFLRQNIGLTQNEISSIQAGNPVAKALPVRTPAEVYLFGAVYIRATPENYFRYATNSDTLRKLPLNLAVGLFSSPPKLSDLNGFSLDSDDIQSLRNSTLGDCMIQVPASSIKQLHQSINWASPKASVDVNQLLQKSALQRLLAYQSNGDRALGTYDDQSDPTQAGQQFALILSCDKTLQRQLPGFYKLPPMRLSSQVRRPGARCGRECSCRSESSLLPRL